MAIAAAVVSVLVAGLLIPIAVGQLRGNRAQLDALDAVNVPHSRIPLIAGAQLAGAVGLLVGLLWRPIGIAAAAGIVLLFVGALVTHLRARNHRVVPALVLLALAASVLVLPSPAKAATCAGPPVMVLTDFTAGPSSATALATRIRAVGRCPHVLAYGKPRLLAQLVPSVTVPVGGMEAIDRMAAEIAPILTKLAGSKRTVDVVGIGIGSLVAVRYQQITKKPVTIRRHVAIGALWNGTNLAGLGDLEQLSRDAGSYNLVLPIEKLLLDGLCASCREMLTGSDFMRAFTKAGVRRPGTAITSIISKSDGLVVPFTSGSLAGARTIVVQDRGAGRVSHFQLPRNATVLTLVGTLLR